MGKKEIIASAAAVAMMGDTGFPNPYFEEMGLFKKGPSSKKYDNKNANIEYYTDEKGNIRRRKKPLKQKEGV